MSVASPRFLFDEAACRKHFELASAALPGPRYFEVMRWLHETLRPASYVEIGVWQGKSLRTASPETVCIGIDPHPIVEGELPANVQIFSITSDEFFRTHDLSRLSCSRPFGLAFIDGLHLWEQALRDFIHLERYAGPDSVILIHDCLPLDETTSARTRCTDFYTGDVWKLMLCLCEQRPDLRMGAIATGPSGLGIVTGLDPTNTTLAERHDSILPLYMPLSFADYRASAERMPRIANDREAIAAWLERGSVKPDHV